jgi:hypothetical protein
MEKTEHGYKVKGIQNFELEFIANRYKPMISIQGIIPGYGKHLCFLCDIETVAEIRAALDAMEADAPSPNSAMLQGLKPHAGGTGTSA